MKHTGISWERWDQLIKQRDELLRVVEDFVLSVDDRACYAPNGDRYEADTKMHGLAVCLNNRTGEALRSAIAKARETNH